MYKNFVSTTCSVLSLKSRFSFRSNLTFRSHYFHRDLIKDVSVTLVPLSMDRTDTIGDEKSMKKVSTIAIRIK